MHGPGHCRLFSKHGGEQIKCGLGMKPQKVACCAPPDRHSDREFPSQEPTPSSYAGLVGLIGEREDLQNLRSWGEAVSLAGGQGWTQLPSAASRMEQVQSFQDQGR